MGSHRLHLYHRKQTFFRLWKNQLSGWVDSEESPRRKGWALLSNSMEPSDSIRHRTKTKNRYYLDATEVVQVGKPLMRTLMCYRHLGTTAVSTLWAWDTMTEGYVNQVLDYF